MATVFVIVVGYILATEGAKTWFYQDRPTEAGGSFPLG